MKQAQSSQTKLWQTLKLPIIRLRKYWQKNWWHKTILIIVSLMLLTIGGMYGIARWYIWSERNTPLTLGTSFVPDYAEFLGVDPHQTLLAILDDLHVKQLRLVSYWSDIEQTKGQYDFTDLDWEFQQADLHHTQVTLSIGLRQPRWPECHMPDWVSSEPTSVWQPQLEQFMTAVINRYKGNPALQSYQLENEYFLTGFGICSDHSRQRLIDEASLVQKLDTRHLLIISRSDNALGWPIKDPKAEAYGISIYRRVWSPPIGRYIEFPFPSWYYAFLAGAEKIWSGKDTIIHELQAEAWPPHGQTIPETTLAEQNKSITAARLKATVQFGKATGMKTIDLWGAEYWYYRMHVLHDPSLWNAAGQEFTNQ